MNPVLESAKFVAEHSNDVSINLGNLKSVCSRFEKEDIKTWTDVTPFTYQRLSDEEELAYIFIFDCLNFCYWGNPKWTIEYQGKQFDGGFAMLASLRRAIEEGISILDPQYLATVGRDSLAHVLRGNVEIPLFEERLNNLREAGSVLIRKFNGDIVNVVKLGNCDVLQLLNVMTENFPLFNDSALYKGRRVYFHKRAQLAIADIYRTFQGAGYGEFHNIQELTSFADYKIPQIMRKLGILEYSEKLSRKVDQRIGLPAGSPEEVEIRANMIWGTELMRQELEQRIPGILAMDIDSYLWIQGQQKSSDDKPYHLTRTIYY